MKSTTPHPQPNTPTGQKQLIITSAAFEPNGTIPPKYTCDGKDVNPSLQIQQVPPEARSLAVIVDDPDAPAGTWVHWVLWNVPVASEIKENDAPGMQGINNFSKHRYNGPCPPGGVHRYFFKVYALDDVLNIPASSDKGDLERAMAPHVLAYGELVGRYSRLGS
jgi:Raf kinase inhibitor-like YbhB/YbcL family protein